jgi:hypothetical protein
MKTSAQFHEQAEFLRESSGSTIIETTLRKAVKVLAHFQIPHYVCGGFAVQEHGYRRFTVDADIIVPDVQLAVEKLSLNGFKANPGSTTSVTDTETKVEVDIRPGDPTHVSSEPQILPLQSLISSKLSIYVGRGIERMQDYADVARLIQANHLPRDYPVDPRVRDTYQTLWDDIYKERLT